MSQAPEFARETPRHHLAPQSIIRVERWFIGVAVPARLRPRLCSIRDTLQLEHGGKAMPAANLHLTLAFLGDTPTVRLPELAALIAAQDWPAQTLRLDRIGSFSAGSGVVWLGCKQPDQQLLDHVARLHAALQRAGFPHDERPYCPHLTLLRGTRAPQTRLAPALHWPLGPITLFASLPGERGPSYAIRTQGHDPHTQAPIGLQPNR
ncbi:RNA 2',3'-cyclic phosphodiesterase [Chitinilyticum litopenaei]|uniref:RNA 2',3'-cyclic phosphodiesterase n=1 Tax=Chitinilyticum litopenaei TaxID=1121276 RepID=UPI00130E3962|nr:RNA 2',3'-cyclic phosphodiesterase [Chitinilyticum litopenaei]